MTLASLHLLPLLLAAAFAVGCDDGPAPAVLVAPAPGAATSSTPAPTPTHVPRASGAITGRVTLLGFSPSRKPQSIACANHAHAIVPDESVVMGPNNALANVIVYLKDAPPGVAAPAATSPALLDQVNCRYVPHVVALQVGQTLQVSSSDATLHNIHGITALNPSFNFGMNGKATRALTFSRPETFRVKCDVHPWMNAYVSVFPHPYFAVTTPDGSFRLSGIPKGTYTLAAWHEKFDMLEQQVTIDESTPLEANFTYQPPPQ